MDTYKIYPIFTLSFSHYLLKNLFFLNLNYQIVKITIELTEQEVKALKAYLKEVSNDIDPVITKEDIKLEIQGIVSGAMQTGSLGDYYQQYATI